MMDLLLHDARIVTPDGVIDGGWLACSGGRIDAIGRAGDPPPAAATSLDLDGGTLLPGFLDLHVHGAVDHDTMDGDPDGVLSLAAHHARHGTTGLLATTWTADGRTTLAALEAIAAVTGVAHAGATVLGAHMEGPYLAAKRCGAQDRRVIRVADPDEAARFLATGVVRHMTIAPEYPENLRLIRLLAERGITASIGHTDATYEQVAAAVEAGARHVTHTFNAMRPLHHREPGTVGAVIDHTVLTVEAIADLIHVHPAVLRTLHRAVGTGRLVLVTDAIRAAGLPDGSYPLGDRWMQVRGHEVRLEDGSLAGSMLTMDVALRNLVAVTGLPLEELWPVVSRNPARVAGLDDRKGELRVGFDADLVAVDDALEVTVTVVGGRVVHRDGRVRGDDTGHRDRRGGTVTAT